MDFDKLCDEIGREMDDVFADRAEQDLEEYVANEADQD